MVPIRQSEAEEPNPELKSLPRIGKETNTQWFERAFDDGRAGDWILLFGGVSLTDFRIRVAQSHVRNDLLPSFWSHTAILDSNSSARSAERRVYEIRLDPVSGFGTVPANNGVQIGRLSDYDDPYRFPNVACLQFPIGKDKAPQAVQAFRNQRSLLDMPSLIVEWLAFVWGAADQGNPLLKGVGVPSAALVEGVYAIADIELTPGISTRSSCPEAIWQSAKWWHQFYASEAVTSNAPPKGCFWIGQEAASVQEDVQGQRPAAKGGKQRRL